MSLPLGEALPAMQNKTIDGMVGAAAPVRRVQVLRHRQADDLSSGHDFCRADPGEPPLHEITGTELEAIVREESRKAEVLFSDWNIADIKRAEDVWRKNGGEMVTLPPAEASVTSTWSRRSLRRCCPPIQGSRRITRHCSRPP